MQLQRQTVRIHEEGHALAGEFVHADGLGLDAHGVQPADHGIDVRHAEGQVAQTVVESFMIMNMFIIMNDIYDK